MYLTDPSGLELSIESHITECHIVVMPTVHLHECVSSSAVRRAAAIQQIETQCKLTMQALLIDGISPHTSQDVCLHLHAMIMSTQQHLLPAGIS